MKGSSLQEKPTVSRDFVCQSHFTLKCMCIYKAVGNGKGKCPKCVLQSIGLLTNADLTLCDSWYLVRQQ